VRIGLGKLEVRARKLGIRVQDLVDIALIMWGTPASNLGGGVNGAIQKNPQKLGLLRSYHVPKVSTHTVLRGLSLAQQRPFVALCRNCSIGSLTLLLSNA
jgi:hypothetical protein